MSRKIEFRTGEYYHVFNRGTDKRETFSDKGDLYYFIDSLFISNQPTPIRDRHDYSRRDQKNFAQKEEKLVSIVAYCLLPNHYHLILKQEIDGGISKFMQKLSNSYTKYYNKKYFRSGVLFQGKFKANHILGEMSVSFTSAYVNLNYKHHKIDPKISLAKSSIFEYLEKEEGEEICNKKEVKKIIDNFGGPDGYKEYIKNQSKYFTQRHGHNPNKIEFTELGLDEID